MFSSLGFSKLSSSTEKVCDIREEGARLSEGDGVSETLSAQALS